MTRPEPLYAVETLNRKGRWEVRRFHRLSDARRFRLAESRRTRINLQVARLTPIEGGIVTEYESAVGRWVR